MCYSASLKVQVGIDWFSAKSYALVFSALVMLSHSVSPVGTLILREECLETFLNICCIWENKKEFDGQVFVFLTVEPKILPFAFPVEVEAGELIQVSCAVSRGDDPIILQWYKDHLPLKSSSNFIINNMDSKLSILLLRSVDAEHRGIYTCSASNPVGNAEFSATLNVKGMKLMNCRIISDFFFSSF